MSSAEKKLNLCRMYANSFDFMIEMIRLSEIIDRASYECMTFEKKKYRRQHKLKDAQSNRCSIWPNDRMCSCAGLTTHKFNRRVNLALNFDYMRVRVSRQSAYVVDKVFGGMALCAR